MGGAVQETTCSAEGTTTTGLDVGKSSVSGKTACETISCLRVCIKVLVHNTLNATGGTLVPLFMNNPGLKDTFYQNRPFYGRPFPAGCLRPPRTLVTHFSRGDLLLCLVYVRMGNCCGHIPACYPLHTLTYKGVYMSRYIRYGCLCLVVFALVAADAHAAKPVAGKKKAAEPAKACAGRSDSQKRTVENHRRIGGGFRGADGLRNRRQARRVVRAALVSAAPHGACVRKGDVLLNLDTEKLDRAITDLRSEFAIAEVGDPPGPLPVADPRADTRGPDAPPRIAPPRNARRDLRCGPRSIRSSGSRTAWNKLYKEWEARQAGKAKGGGLLLEAADVIDEGGGAAACPRLSGLSLAGWFGGRRVATALNLEAARAVWGRRCGFARGYQVWALQARCERCVVRGPNVGAVGGAVLTWRSRVQSAEFRVQSSECRVEDDVAGVVGSRRQAGGGGGGGGGASFWGGAGSTGKPWRVGGYSMGMRKYSGPNCWKK